MRKFQYHTELLDISNLDEVLNEYGANGWRAVVINNSRNAYIVAVTFERFVLDRLHGPHDQEFPS